MKFYYTGSETFGGKQTSIEKSLGGYMSSTPVPNGRLSNIFGDISKYSQDKLFVETKAIVLVNELGQEATDIYLYYNYPADCLVKILVAPTTLANGGQKMEKIASQRESPYYGTFIEANGVGNKILLADTLANGDAIGIWFRREIQPNSTLETILAKDLEAYLLALAKEELVSLVIEWETA